MCNKAIKPNDKKDECAEKMQNSAAHINKNWIIGILAILAIILSAVILSSQLFEKDNVARIISFTATILSIVLSLLAILYSYLGNIESSENLSEIRIAVAEIKATEEGIKHFISSLNLGSSNGGATGAINKIEEEKGGNKTPSNNAATSEECKDSPLAGNANTSTELQNGEE